MGFEQDYDVVVAGAGVAGVAAALECARAGMRTALVEKTVLVGGLATTGLVNFYLPLCDGRGHQVIYGIAEELLHLSIKYGPGAVMGIVVENKSGRGVLRAQCVIDATGDADVAYRAGAKCVETDNWLSLWGVQASLARARQAAADPATGLLDMVRVGGDANGRGHPVGQPKYHGTDGAEVTRFVLESRRLLRELYQAKQSEIGDAGRHQIFPVTLPSMAQFRTTRRIDGVETMLADQENTEIATSVGVIPDWRKAGPVREIPYGALIPQGVKGLLTVGRCMSAEGEAWEVARVIPPAALTGQLAGIAATFAIRHRTTPDALVVDDIQAAVRSQGLPLHASDIAGLDL